MIIFPELSNLLTAAGRSTSVSPSPYVAMKTSSSPMYCSTSFSRSPIVERVPVSANVIRHGPPSRFRISTSASAP
jgi:hypothetical protein